MSKAPKERKEGPVIATKTQVEADKAWASMVESSMRVTRSATRAKADVAKVK